MNCLYTGMGILSWITRRLTAAPRAYTLGGGNFGASGRAVTDADALSLSALICGVKAISDALSILPLRLLKDTPKGVETQKGPLADMLEFAPNPEQERPVFWAAMAWQYVLEGNALAEIERDGAGNPISLWPINPRDVKISRNAQGQIVYKVAKAAKEFFFADEIFHVVGLSPLGDQGLRFMDYARSTIDFATAARLYGAATFNGARPSGVLEFPGTMTDEDYERTKKRWNGGEHAGAQNANQTPIVEGGLKFTPLTRSTNEQAQVIDALNFSVIEVARLINISPTKLYELSAAKYNSLELLNGEFWTTTMHPICERIELQADRKLGLRAKGLYCEFDPSAMLWTDAQTRSELLGKEVGDGRRTLNEARDAMRLPRYDTDDANKPRMQFNTGTI